MKPLDLIVIGAGWSGLLALKHALAHGLTAQSFELRDEVGGIWNFQEAPGGVMRSTVATSSLTMTEISDFPLHGAGTDFPHHTQLFGYLKDYADHFDLRRHIHFGAPVEQVQKIDGLWTVTGGGLTRRARHLVVSSGNQRFPNDGWMAEAFAGFPGRVLHSASYKEPRGDYSGRRVLIVGGGESATDIATELSYVADQVILSIPNGQWFGERYREGIASPFPLEHFSTRLRRWVLPGNEHPEMFELLRALIERRDGFQGHGIEAWRSQYEPYGASIINKNTEILRRIRFGRVTPKGRFVRAEGDVAHFEDGSTERFDAVIGATGFRSRFPFLAEVGRERVEPERLYKICLDTSDPTLGFVGLARPTRGSFPSLSESQARLLAKMWSGTISTPDEATRVAVAKADAEARDAFYGGANQRVRGLVNLFEYNDDLAGLCGMLPDWGALYRADRRKWWVAITAPYHQCQYLLGDPSWHDHCFERFEFFRAKTPAAFHAFGFVARAWYEGHRARRWLRGG